MDQETYIEVTRLIAKAIIIASMWGSALGISHLAGKAFEAMGRNPEIAGALFTRMIVGAALTESIAIYAFVAFFII